MSTLPQHRHISPEDEAQLLDSIDKWVEREVRLEELEIGRFVHVVPRSGRRKRDLQVCRPGVGKGVSCRPTNPVEAGVHALGCTDGVVASVTGRTEHDP